jgi:elongation factor G
MQHPGLVEIAIEPRSDDDQARLNAALAELAADDPLLTVTTDHESGQTIMAGMSELHLDIKLEALERAYRIGVNIGAPQVAYRETLGHKADVEYTHDKHTGGGRQFACVRILFEPGAPGSGFVFESRIADGAIAEEFMPGIPTGIESARDSGLLAGFPVTDFKATLHGGASDERDSTILAFEIASRAAFRQLKEKASPRLLEPIMKVLVAAPQDHMGDIIGDLNSRRGQIEDVEARPNVQLVSAMVPLSNMFGYVSHLHGMSRGRALATLTFDHYAPTLLPNGDDPTFPPAVGLRA